MKFETHRLLPKYRGVGFHIAGRALMILLWNRRLDFIYRPMTEPKLITDTKGLITLTPHESNSNTTG